MIKITAIVSLMLIATWSYADTRRQKKDAVASGDYEPGSTLWAASLSCDSCGSECASACGTRHFRACCFNYLRRKRGSEGIKFWSPNTQAKTEIAQKPKAPVPVFVESLPETWLTNLVSNDFEPYLFEETPENRLQILYDV